MPDGRIPWALNLVIAVLAIAVDAACLWLAAHTQSWWLIVAAAAVFSFSNHTLFALGHEAVHGILFPCGGANEAVGSLLAASFPQSFCLQRAFHLSHHRNNRTDSEFFDGIGPGDIAWIKRWQWYGILLGEYWLTVPIGCVVWLLCPWLMMRPWLRDANCRPVRSWGGYGVLEALARVPPLRSRLEVVWAAAVQIAAWHWLELTPTACLACYGAFALNWGSLQYAAHAFSERHVRDGAFDLKAPRLLRIVLLNYHLHRAHHRQPTAPWISLPRSVDESRPRPTFAMQYATMWRGPRRAWGRSPDPEEPADDDPDVVTAGGR